LLYLACYTQDEIAKSMGTTETPVKAALADFLETLPKNPKASFLDTDFAPPLYNVWTFAKNWLLTGFCIHGILYLVPISINY